MLKKYKYTVYFIFCLMKNKHISLLAMFSLLFIFFWLASGCNVLTFFVHTLALSMCVCVYFVMHNVDLCQKFVSSKHFLDKKKYIHVYNIIYVDRFRIAPPLGSIRNAQPFCATLKP